MLAVLVSGGGGAALPALNLDRLISRTVTYAVVTALLVLPYLLILPAATLAVVAAFSALRRRFEYLVDWRFNRPPLRRRRHRGRIRGPAAEQVDLDALSSELLAVVVQTVAPTRASLWQRPSARSWGTDVAVTWAAADTHRQCNAKGPE